MRVPIIDRDSLHLLGSTVAKSLVFQKFFEATAFTVGNKLTQKQEP